MQLFTLKTIRRHVISRLDLLRIDDPPAESAWYIRKRFRRNHAPAANVRQIRAHPRARLSPLDCVAHETCVRQEYFLA